MAVNGGAPQVMASLLNRQTNGAVRIDRLGAWAPRLRRNGDGTVTVEG